uniref:Uncharacterized protein n=1 Tax=Rhizophora mucronata TaxID=61149 RepID=A0A2P2NN85_RHIMU
MVTKAFSVIRPEACHFAKSMTYSEISSTTLNLLLTYALQKVNIDFRSASGSEPAKYMFRQPYT